MSKSEALRAYLMKNYAPKEKRKKKKDKLKKLKQPTNNELMVAKTSSTPTNNTTNIDHNKHYNHTNDNYDMRMPDLNDGSGWNADNTNILAPTRKRKHDDNSNRSKTSPPTKRIKRQRYDTDSESDMEVERKPKQTNVRYDTSDEDDSDIEVARKPSNKNEESDSDSDMEVERKPSKIIKDENENKTVYRDKNGKRISENEYNKMKQKHNKRHKDDANDMEWASGLVQKYKAFEKAVVVQRQKFQSIARYKDDAEMNIDLQNEHREEDPLNDMEGYKDKIKHNREDTDGSTGMNGRPMYKGKPWPNRYGILPGYRWDGVDRSNGFEGKKLLHQSQRIDYKNRRYKAANADM
eukprot:265744_1